MHYKDKTVIQTYVSNELLEKLKIYARKENRTVSNCVNNLICKYVAEQEKQEGNNANI